MSDPPRPRSRSSSDTRPASGHRAGSRPLLIVDGANVVGSVPDGWWRDRRGAADRLRIRLEPVAVAGLEGVPGPLEVVLVVEGRARGVEASEHVRVVDAPGTGDDTIVDVVADADPRRERIVVTADRELRVRVQRLGARAIGPYAIPR
ncbi:hypothetical protein [Gordonia sp. NPDC058843]|uniref:hypothetical protein n=1 Tax=Gordonia sp. NPDC058843 TaxID=3346648 RepID=UPI0036CE5E53